MSVTFRVDFFFSQCNAFETHPNGWTCQVNSFLLLSCSAVDLDILVDFLLNLHIIKLILFDV